MRQENEQLRNYARRQNVRIWQIADALRIHEMTIYRRWRKQLSKEEDQNYRCIIDSIAEANRENEKAENKKVRVQIVQVEEKV